MPVSRSGPAHNNMKISCFSSSANVNRKTVDSSGTFANTALPVELSSHCERCAHLIQFKCTRYSRDNLTLSREDSDQNHQISSEELFTCTLVKLARLAGRTDSFTWTLLLFSVKLE